MFERRFFLLIFSLLFFSFSLHAQKVSGTKSIAVFRLSYYDWDMPEALYNAVDNVIVKSFLDMKRFEIIAMSHRISSADLEGFIQKIQEDRKKAVELPEEVLAGKQAFTKADWERLVNSYIIVVPTVTDYAFKRFSQKVDTDNDGVADTVKYSYSLLLKVNVYLRNMQNNKSIANFTLQHSGFGDSPEMAFLIASSTMMLDLQYKLRSVSDFKITTGVSKVSGQFIEFELGSNMGISVGDEFTVIGYERKDGIAYEKQVALVMVIAVSDEKSTAQILFSKSDVLFADQLKEVARLPMEFNPYFNVGFPTMPPEERYIINGSIGLKIIHTRGFYKFRPLYGIDINFSQNSAILGVPVRIFAGCQLGNVFVGIFQFSPEIQVGGGMLLKSLSEKPVFSDFFVKGLLGFNFLVTKDIKLGFDIGCDLGFKSENHKSAMMSNFILGFGITIK
ncbi:MAG: hypothetical protein CR988_06015 [Treponema sp.]|nr:MAG: hypothetical protein CR988_06015 [Treponema sp.]